MNREELQAFWNDPQRLREFVAQDRGEEFVKSQDDEMIRYLTKGLLMRQMNERAARAAIAGSIAAEEDWAHYANMPWRDEDLHAWNEIQRLQSALEEAALERTDLVGELDRVRADRDRLQSLADADGEHQ